MGISENEILQDGLGSVVGKLEGDKNGPSIMLAGHMDEIGMIVTKITDEGYLNFKPSAVGGARLC